MENCSVCEQLKGCTKCKEKFFFSSSKKFQKCGENCKQCKSYYHCQECMSKAYYLRNNKCIKCPVDEGCVKCQDKKGCLECKPGFKIVSSGGYQDCKKKISFLTIIFWVMFSLVLIGGIVWFLLKRGAKGGVGDGDDKDTGIMLL